MQSISSEAAIRQRACQQFDGLGYTLIDGSQEEHGPCSATGRRSAGDVVLLPRLRAALQALNPDIPATLIDKAIEKLTESRSLFSLAAANEQIYALLKDGIKVDTRLGTGAEQSSQDARQDTHKTLQVINWKEADKNDFALVSHLWIDGKLGKRRLDLVGFVNGLPLILLEIADSDLQNTFERIDRDYKATLPALFWYNAFIIVAEQIRKFSDALRLDRLENERHSNELTRSRAEVQQDRQLQSCLDQRREAGGSAAPPGDAK